MSAVQRFTEKVVFGARPLVLLVFAVITVAMVFFASQLKVDAGFKKQIPLQHEYMKTFLDYEADFGGADRVLIAVIAKDGNMFSDEYLTALQQVTKESSPRGHDDSRSRSLFTPNVRFIEVVEDGIRVATSFPTTTIPVSSPHACAVRTDPRQYRQGQHPGRLVAKDWSGACLGGHHSRSTSQPTRASRLPEDRQAARGIRQRHEKETSRST